MVGLVNNAGIACGGPIGLLELDEYRRLFEVNFFAVIAATQAFIPLLRAGHGGIVNVSSISGMVASPFLSPYSSSKWALEALSDALFKLSTEKVRVRVIHKGVGAITESDVLLAAASNANIIGFHVRPEERANELALQEGVDMRLYNIIYEALDAVKKALEGM